MIYQIKSQWNHFNILSYQQRMQDIFSIIHNQYVKGLLVLLSSVEVKVSQIFFKSVISNQNVLFPGLPHPKCQGHCAIHWPLFVVCFAMYKLQSKLEEEKQNEITLKSWRNENEMIKRWGDENKSMFDGRRRGCSCQILRETTASWTYYIVNY